jgi:hypothetical protein
MLLGASLNCLFPRDPKQLRWGQLLRRPGMFGAIRRPELF